MNSATPGVRDANSSKEGRKSADRSVDSEVAVIGAGPYGLSAAAHLKSDGLEVCVFGQAMEFWERKMPSGMLLRSPRVASTISDPLSSFTLEAFEGATGTKARERVQRETFVDYGKWFQKRAVCGLDSRNVSLIRKRDGIFSLTLSDEGIFRCKKVIVAAGIGPFKRIPAPFSHLSPSLVSHCYDGRPFRSLGRRVAVIGAGQSALESAALLREAGLEAEVIAKISALRWIGMHKRLHQLGFVSRILYSKHDIGPIGISRLVAYPNLMYHMPLRMKDRVRKRAVRAAGAPWLMPRLQEVKTSLGRAVVAAKEVHDEVQLILDDGSERRVDHVLLGTGYDVDISKYDFLSPELLAQIRQIAGYPDVGAGFESSVKGLHFIGATAARKYGPLLYFVTGTEFASKELASYIAGIRN